MLQLIKACLHPDAAQRPSAEQLLRFPFFKGVDLALPPALRYVLHRPIVARTEHVKDFCRRCI